MDVMKLLEYLQEILETSAKVPLTGKVMIDKDEILKVIDEIVEYLPEEIKKAKWICDEKDKILEDAMIKAEKIKAQKVDALKREIENHDISKEAKIKAEHIITSAQKDAKMMRLGARDYAESVLIELQNEVDTKSNDMLLNVKKEVENFLLKLEEQVSNTSLSIKDNIKELKNMK